MSEKEHLLSYSSESSGGPLGRVRDVVTKAEDAVKKPWIRFVKLLHAREFFAEFVATFMLIVSAEMEFSTVTYNYVSFCRLLAMVPLPKLY